MAAFDASELKTKNVMEREVFRKWVLDPDLFPEELPRLNRKTVGNVVPLRQPIPLERFKPILQICMAELVEDRKLTAVDKEVCEEIMGWDEPKIQTKRTEIFYLPSPNIEELASLVDTMDATILYPPFPVSA
jgi:hypothetical protein